jgi:predicted nucleotidyltransferase
MIPTFNDYGCLPEGIYDCTMDEAAERFGVFQSSDWRPRLWARLTEFIRQVKGCGFVETVIVDGSFVTSKPNPSDIDLVLVVATSHDFSADLTPAHYSLLAQRRVRRRFGFDIVVVKNGSENLELAVAFFQQVKQRPSVKKGILRIRL